MLISIEGYDNAGKTTYIKGLKKRLEKKAEVEVISTADTTSGKIIRNHYKNKDNISKQEELILHMRSIDELTARYIGCNSGVIQIIDRYVDSTIAYQSTKQLKELESWYLLYMNMLDHTVYIDLDKELYLERLQKTNKIEHPEERNIEHYERVTTMYKQLSKIDCKREYYTVSSRDLIEK